jgi:hypothetical protein
MRYRDKQDIKIVDHVDDTKGEKERVDLYAGPLCARELSPKMVPWSTDVTHGDPDHYGIRYGKKVSELHGQCE